MESAGVIQVERRRCALSELCLALLAALCWLGCARATESQQPYRVDMAPTGNGGLDATLQATSDLIALRSSAPVSAFGLIARARGDIDRLQTVLESFGYYQSSVSIQINGMALNDPNLAEGLNSSKNREARVAVGFALGPLYHLRTVTIDGELPASVQGVLALEPGAAAVAANVLGAGARLLAALQEQGYAFAKVDPPIAYEDQTEPVLDVSFHVETGPKLRIGAIQLKGLRGVQEKYVRRRLLVHTGEQYSPSAVERARADLLGLGVFAAVTVRVGTSVDESGGVPISFLLRERKKHAVTLSAAYSSDLGGSGTVIWSDRNLFGSAEQLSVSGSLINLGGGTASTGIGYDTGVKLVKPDFGRRDQSLLVSVTAVKQFLQAYDQTAVTTGVGLLRKLNKEWSVSAGVSSANEHVIQPPSGIGSVPHDYTLYGLPLSVTYDSTDLNSPLDDPLHGIRASLSVAPTRSLGQTDATFVISRLNLATYFDLEHLFGTPAGRSVLAGRILIGYAQGAGESSLPPDQRFYAGGSGTIRGYRYQSVGPQQKTCAVVKGTLECTNSYPVGGTALTAGTLELRQRFGANWGAALFVDGGQVSETLRPLPATYSVGAGAGLRYYTPIGPIRLDIAVPTSRIGSSPDSFEIYVGLGQSF